VNDPRRILVVGAGGREHALAWRLAGDPHGPDVVMAPGVEGAASRFRCLPVDGGDPVALVRACRSERFDLVVVGPEGPLAAGLVDALTAEGIQAFGPTQAAARLESSKWFAKECMREAGVPTARASVVDRIDAARAALDRYGAPFVVKADGLAAGKGVRVTASREEAERFAEECLRGGRFGASGRHVVIEEYLEGEEVSVMAVCDGSRFVCLPPARDHKRAFDGDEGPNTGGMGAYAPVASLAGTDLARVGAEIVAPLLGALRARGTPFRGLLYAGLMLAPGGPRVLEFNVRFGDPETQAVLPLVAGSFSRLLLGAARGALEPAVIANRSAAAVAVAIVDEGYPDAPLGSGEIEGLDALEGREGTLVFHAATARHGAHWAVRGGRAAYVVGLGEGVPVARERAYGAIDSLAGSGWRCRRDIAGPAPRPEPAAQGRAS
jgi:phosphoribosylamine---glycine ligase